MHLLEQLKKLQMLPQLQIIPLPDEDDQHLDLLQQELQIIQVQTQIPPFDEGDQLTDLIQHPPQFIRRLIIHQVRNLIP